MRIMITGGGTGGHTSPAVAIVEELRRRDPELLAQWVGKRGGIEERVSGFAGVPFRAVLAEGWPRRNSPKRLWVLCKLAIGCLQSVVYLRRFRPQVVIGVGGYVSLPLLIAAQRLGVPTVVHEQNKRLGMANRVNAKRAARIFLSYEDTLGDYPKNAARLVGNPVRAGFILPPDREEAKRRFGVEGDAPVVLVSGGSQGARSVNHAVAAMLPLLAPGELRVIWMTGKESYPEAVKAAEPFAADVKVFPFIDEMPAACVAADIIVSRAGASTAAELAVLGKPSVLAPYPFATDAHQDKNAQAFEEVGAAVVMKDDALSGEALLKQLRELLGDRERLEAMAKAAAKMGKPHAGETIAEEIMSLIFGAPMSGKAVK